MLAARRVGWLALVLVTACGGETAPTEPAPEKDPPPEQPEAPPPLQVVEGFAELEDMNDDPAIVEVALTASLGQAELTPGTLTDVMTFNGSTPGPMLHARVGDRVIVHFANDLPEATTIHWHGLRISDQMDGNPRIQNPVEPGGTFTYDFVLPEAGTYWYHPHANTIEQVERGLYGAIVVEEEEAPVQRRSGWRGPLALAMPGWIARGWRGRALRVDGGVCRWRVPARVPRGPTPQAHICIYASDCVFRALIWLRYSSRPFG